VRDHRGRPNGSDVVRCSAMASTGNRRHRPAVYWGMLRPLDRTSPATQTATFGLG